MASISRGVKSLSLLFSKCYNYQKLIAYSTAPLSAVQNVSHRFRTLENNPLLHTEDHIGKFYLIPPNEVKKLFSSGGIPKSLMMLMESFNESCVMIRKPSVEIISILKKINYSQPAVRFVLYGKYGTGKTSSLIHLVHYGYHSKHLLLHLPWVSNWTKRPKEIVNSQFKEGRIDLPVESALWLQHFKLQNSELMKELDLKTSKEYTWSKREITEKDAPLMEVVEHGLKRVRHSSDCVAVLLKEIKQQSHLGKFKTMVVIDGMNAFYSKTNIKRSDRTLAPACDVTIVNAFMKLLKNDWNNAVILTTVDTVPHNRETCKVDPYTPRYLLGKEAFEVLDPFIPIQTDNYTEKEADSTLDYYVDRFWIQSQEAQEESGRKQLKFLSGYNPDWLRKLCDPL
ncbi:28S ribosomal protein S29, mitochondrial-like [Uloborus diversus]|uniref:28S ribosomal protein S29, mitochondrial-like n=1 Tax=Uloborus diversus TaxID=327109 RepID=UPI00240A976F|nr:28S ribosomal protein S29, mitochondrial-like [Uloborus diversus]